MVHIGDDRGGHTVLLRNAAHRFVPLDFVDSPIPFLLRRYPLVVCREDSRSPARDAELIMLDTIWGEVLEQLWVQFSQRFDVSSRTLSEDFQIEALINFYRVILEGVGELDIRESEIHWSHCHERDGDELR